MTRQNLKEVGLTELDLERALWHMKHGTKEFRDFLGGGLGNFEVAFARWLKENVKPGVANP